MMWNVQKIDLLKNIQFVCVCVCVGVCARVPRVEKVNHV